jgi:hypothetical protein
MIRPISMTVSLVVSAVVVVVGIVGSVIFGPAVERRCLYSIPEGFPESTGVSWTESWWPPGSRCIYTLPDGSVTVVVKAVSFEQWVSVLLLAGLIFGACQLVAMVYRIFLRSYRSGASRKEASF